MRNRAKCKLCRQIIESYTVQDYIECSCGEIAVSGGLQELQVYAKDFSNFLRIDDNDNEITVIVTDPTHSEAISQPSRKDLLNMLEELRKRIESLPQEAMLAPITHIDYLSLIYLLQALFRSE